MGNSVTYLVLQIDWGVEVGDLGVDRFANHLAFASVHHGSHLCQTISNVSCDGE